MFNWLGGLCGGFYNSNFIFGGHIFMMIFGFLLVVAVLYFLFRKNSGMSLSKEEAPLDLLQKRYVNGEINKEEYLSKKETISKGK